METVTLTKKEYSELLEIKNKFEELLRLKRKKVPVKGDGLKRAFGILKGEFRGDSLSYISKLRKEWRR